MTVTALRSFTYRDRAYMAGDRLDVTPVEAAVLRRSGDAALDSDLGTRRPVEPKKRRTYRRRDLTADPS